MYKSVQDPGIRPYSPLVALALRTPGWGFHIVRDDVNPGDHRFRPQFIEVVEAWIKDL